MKHSLDSSAPRSRVCRSRGPLIPLILLLLVSLACSVPELGQISLKPSPQAAVLPTMQPQSAGTPGAAAPAVQTPGATGAGVPVGTPVAPAANVPPELVEVEPIPSSEIGPNTAPVFYFNQSMQRPSVEAAFQTQPELAGHFEWLNDATVRFVPGKPVNGGEALRLTIGAGAKAANGMSLTEPVQVSYQAVGPLSLSERLPTPDSAEVNPSSAVVVTFNRAVVALGADAQSLPAAFTLDPPSNGRREWLNTSTYIFYPQPALTGGARYTVRLNAALTSVEGSPLSSDTSLEWAFTTAAPVLQTIKPGTEQPVPLDSPFTLTFNQPMDTASVEGDFSLLGPGGAVPGKFTWNSTATEGTFKPNDLLQRGGGYTLALFGSARSQGGAPIGRDFAASLSAVSQFAVTQTRPAGGESLEGFQGYGSVALTFSSPVAGGQDFNSLISLNPPIVDQMVNRDTDGYQLYVSGYFNPSTSYSLSISPGLSDRWGAKLDAPYSFTFSSQPAQPALVIPVLQGGAHTLFVPQNETTIPSRTTNINRLVLSRGQLSLNDYIRAEQDSQGLQNWEPKVQASWPVVLYPAPDKSETTNIPLAQNGSTLDSGLYFLNINTQPSPASNASTSPVLLVVSPIQMVFKVSARQAFVWAVRVPENTPAANAVINFYDSGATVLGSCTTDAQGTCQAELPAREDSYKPLFAVHGQPNDADFSLASSNWYSGVATWEYGLPYQSPAEQPEVYLYTDRPIYRPGQMVNFRVIARGQDNGRYANAPFNQVTVGVVSPYDAITGQSQLLTTMRLALDAYGAATGVYTLPDDARPGSYTLRLENMQFKTINFEVAEYRKPEIDLQVKFDQADALSGSDLQAQVTARYFFGAPAGNMAVRWSLLRSRRYPNIPGGFESGRLDTGWLSPWQIFGAADLYVLDGETQTGPDGTAAIRISGQDLRNRMDTATGDLQELKLEVTVEDESGLPVSARSTMRLHPSPYYIGVRPELWSIQAGQEITYTIHSVDWQGGQTGDKPLKARFLKVKWVQQETSDPLAPPDYHPEYTEVGSTDFRTSPQGEARLAFTPTEPGTFMLEVTGEGGLVTQLLTWVGGMGSTEWPDLPNQRILLRSDAGDSPQSQYQPGHTAHIFIPNPFQGSALALITTERGKVMHTSVVQIQGASYDLQLPLTIDDAPNIYLSVTLLGRANNRPDFRVGYLELQVDPTALKLQVTVETSPQQPQPGGEVTVNIRVKNSEGKPVQGEFSLALIDKAVLALADPNSRPIFEAFYGRQPLSVQSSFSLAEYSGRSLYLPPGRGGGGGGAVQAAPVRMNFADTAYWNGSIQTDVTGVAQITLTLPDNLTTWRADVRGLTADTLVGQASADLIASKPLLVRPVALRFAVPGDHMALSAVVHNNTQDALQASVRLEASGFLLDDLNQAVQRVDIPAGERRQVDWWGTVQDVPALDLTFSAEAGALSDSAHPEQNPLPVLAYTAPQTFGTSGVLSAAGEHSELVSLPRSFTPTGGALRVELSPSLSATVLEGLKALEAYPHDFTEPILSRMLPSLAAYQALKDLQIDNDTQRGALQSVITDSVDRLVRMQNENGGWGWAAGYTSDAYISSYALLGLSRAAQMGVFVDPQVLQKGRDFLSTIPIATQPWQFDRLAFQYFALQQAGQTDLNLNAIYNVKDQLSPWGKAFLALTMEGQSPGDPHARTLLTGLESAASRSASGASWQDPNPAWQNWSTSNFTTAVAAYAIARMDASSPLLVDAVRSLVYNRRPDGAWSSSYETAWALMALVEAARSSGEMQASFAFTALLNGSPLAQGKAASQAPAVEATVPLSSLHADGANTLTLQHSEGNGRLYYRAYLQVNRPAQDAPAIQRGITITRQYYRSGQDCRNEACTPVDSFDLADPQPVLVRLTLTVPEELHYVVVEDTIPAGAEVLNPRLKTSQQNVIPANGQAPSADQTVTPLPYNLENPFDQGWGWWLFKDPQVFDNRIRWVVDILPAGTYELTYRLTPFLAGEFRVIPAHAWEYYFPDVEGTSKGGVLNIH